MAEHPNRFGVEAEGDVMEPGTRERLEAFYEPRNTRLCELLGRGFGW